jgi:acyl-CoA thioester hydrolase/thioesterase-3
MQIDVERQVLPEHTDEVGHFNHVAAVKFLEDAREAWYVACGLPEYRPGELGTVVVNLNLNYRAECFAGDTLKLRVTPQTMGSKSFVLGLCIFRPDGAVAVEGTATNVVMDLTKRSIIAVPQCLSQHLRPGTT